MSTVTIRLPPRAVYTTEPIYRFTVEQWHDMIARGTLTADDPVELVEGVPVFKMPKNEPHIAAGRRLRRAVERVLPEGYFFGGEQPIALADGEPEPDGMVVRGGIEQFDDRKVVPADAIVVVEIADSTLDSDRGSKLRSYARAAIACYWIVNLIDRQIERYTEPDAAAAVPRYRTADVYRPGNAVPLALDGLRGASVAVSDVLPPAERHGKSADRLAHGRGSTRCPSVSRSAWRANLRGNGRTCTARQADSDRPLVVRRFPSRRSVDSLLAQGR